MTRVQFQPMLRYFVNLRGRLSVLIAFPLLNPRVLEHREWGFEADLWRDSPVPSRLCIIIFPCPRLWEELNTVTRFARSDSRIYNGN